MERSPAPRLVSFGSVEFTPRFAHGDQASVAVITGPEDRTELGTGLARFSGADFAWTVQYDEVLLVFDGAIEVVIAGEVLRGRKLDSLWLPKGTPLRYRADTALVFYAIHPAGWAVADGYRNDRS